MKNYQEALPQLQKGVELSGRSSESLGCLGFFYGKTESVMRHSSSSRRTRIVIKRAPALRTTLPHLRRLGEKEKALEWLEQDYRDRSTWISSLTTDYMWDDVRTIRALVQLTKNAGLVE